MLAAFSKDACNLLAWTLLKKLLILLQSPGAQVCASLANKGSEVQNKSSLNGCGMNEQPLCSSKWRSRAELTPSFPLEGAQSPAQVTQGPLQSVPSDPAGSSPCIPSHSPLVCPRLDSPTSQRRKFCDTPAPLTIHW